MRRHTLGGLVLAVIVLILDQASKQATLTAIDLPDRGVVPLLPGFLDLTMVWNQGVTFGLLRHAGAVGPVLLACVAIGIVAILLLWLRRAETAMTAWAIGAIAGGALGNVIDRFRFGKVVDFIHLHWAAWDPFPFVFNVGDSAIVLGVATLLLEGVVSRRKV